MNIYLVTYSGNSSRFKDFSFEVLSSSRRKAVEIAYQKIMDDNFFPKEDGTIEDCDGYIIAEKNDDLIKYDGGFFSAELIDR